MAHTVAIAGAGIFGTTAAIELRRRGWEVVLADPEVPPAPRAASTDISKVVRREYGSDTFYLELAAQAIEGWRRWNAAWPEPLYHEVGLLVLSRGALDSPGFAGDSWRALRASGCDPVRLSGVEIARRYPAWRGAPYPQGFWHGAAGWVESGRVVSRLLEMAREAGVELRAMAVSAPLVEGSRVVGLLGAAGERLVADRTVIAAGVWSGRLAGIEWGVWPTLHPVFHLRPAEPEQLAADRFPVFMADIAASGWYGFPLHPREGVVKVARHGAGRRVDPDAPRVPDAVDEEALRRFLGEALPSLAGAPLVSSRGCLYCDTADGHFWIDRDPQRPELVVATGGSGHAFKFAPRLGSLVADVVEERDNRWLSRFRWRREARAQAGEEQARAPD